MSALKLTALAVVVAAFLIAPTALLADETSPDSSVSSSDGGLEYGSASDSTTGGGESSTNADPNTTAAPSTTAEPSTDSASVETGDNADRSTESNPQASASAGAAVTIGDFFFRPQDISVPVGGSVTWTNDGTVPEGHTVTGDGFDSGVLKHGESYSRVFATVGSFDYVCTLHPNMRGTVTVTAQGSGDNQTGGGGTAAQSGGASGGVVPSTAQTTPATASAGESGGSLAHTGLNLILLAEIAGCFIATGLLIQRLIYGAP